MKEVQDIVDTESSYASSLHEFWLCFVLPLQVHFDTVKQKLVDGDSSILFSSCSLVVKFLQSSLNFRQSLCTVNLIKGLDVDFGQISNIFLEMAPTLIIYSEYISIVCDAVQLTKLSEHVLKGIVHKCSTPIEDFFILPLKHFQNYSLYLERMISFAKYSFESRRMSQNEETAILMMKEAHDLISRYTRCAEDSMKKETEMFKLLAIQSQCKNPYSCRHMNVRVIA